MSGIQKGLISILTVIVSLSVSARAARSFALYPRQPRWHDSDIPLKYYITQDVPDWGVQPIINAFDTWTGVAGSYVSYERTFNASDANITIKWGPIDGPSNDLARTNTPAPEGDGEVRRIRSKDSWIKFDSAEEWDTSGSPDPGEVDVETVALHEVGHTITLYHSSDPTAVMYIPYDGVQRALAQDDKDRAIFIYPEDVQQAVNIAYDYSKGKVIISKAYSQDVSMKGEVSLIGSSIVGTGGVINGTVSFKNLGASTTRRLKRVKVTPGGFNLAVDIYNSFVTIEDVTATAYAGIKLSYSSPVIKHSRLSNCSSGIYAYYSDPKLQDNAKNQFDHNDWGICATEHSEPNLQNGHNDFEDPGPPEGYDISATPLTKRWEKSSSCIRILLLLQRNTPAQSWAGLPWSWGSSSFWTADSSTGPLPEQRRS